ncbi:MAG: TrkH family potassium uptake protein [Psittacicella sp.]
MLSLIYKKLHLSEQHVIVLSFLLILFPCAGLLTTSYATNHSVSFINALFTATSAMSVTGLNVINPGTQFNIFGDGILMFLMQVGGIGQMTLSVLILYVLGVRVSIRQQSLVKESLGQDKTTNIRLVIKYIVTFSFVVELVGAVILGIVFIPKLGIEDGILNAIFTSISAFNNAGFALFSNNLVSYVSSPMVCITVAVMFILGGIGFTVIIDVLRNGKKGFNNLNLHTKIMLLGTFFLLLIGTILIWLFERDNPLSLGKYSLGTQILASFFQVASTRTAGFNTVNLAYFHNYTLFIIIIFMLIGAGSSSTGGGIKVSTFVVLMAGTWAFLIQRKDVVLFKTRILDEVLIRSLSVVIISLSIIALATLSMMFFENASLLKALFEIISAFSTVGLSAGLSSHLNLAGKIITIIIMIIGRLGPLTLLYMFTSQKSNLVKYPSENVLTG